MPCSAKYSVTLQTEILSTETLDFLKQIFLARLDEVQEELLYTSAFALALALASMAASTLAKC